MGGAAAYIRPVVRAGLVAALVAIGGCAQAPLTAPRSQDSAALSTPLAISPAADTGRPTPSSGTVASPSAIPPAPSPTSVYGCPSGPCPSSLQYAVNGCRCAGQIYDDSVVTATFCCGSGFSDGECPDALEQQKLAESIFGGAADEVETHLVTVRLQGWPAQVHEKAAPAFQQAAARIENMSYRIREPVQSYSRRNVGGHEVLSLHSFGIAVDINPSTNPSCGVTESCRCFNDLITDIPAEFVQAFKDASFEWGGDWVEHPDPMHFEWAGWR